MKVLVVAPDLRLDTIKDILAAVEGNQATVLEGTVSVREVLNRIAGGGYDVIHFATHGENHVLYMSDGKISEEVLYQALVDSGVGLVVLNACNTIHLAAEIYRAGVPRVIGWRDAVWDSLATLWVGNFYRLYAMSGDVGQSFRGAAEICERRAAKDKKEYEPPILLNGRLSALEVQLHQLMAAQNSRREYPVWILVVVLGAMILEKLLFLEDTRSALGLSPWEAALGSVMVIGLALVVVVWLIGGKWRWRN